MSVVKVLILFVIVTLSSAQDVYKVVNIKQGPVKGYKVPNYDVFAYYSIPYATAPTGRNKFKAPLPPPNWTETFEAVDMNIRCPQHGIYGNAFKEDCLVATVFVPDTNATNLPVLFHVHGGAFQFGHGNSYLPMQLIDYKKNVILVSFNYRLGPHGFLCLGTPDIPGNAGMRDQVAALKWVNKNIGYFGGNPDDITLVGCSAGGASVDLLLLSKTTKGLYKKVIGQSGANIGAFGAQVDPTKNARVYAKDINYDGLDNITALEEFYKSIPYERLHSVNLGNTKDVAVVFSPCVERELGFERFLDDTPVNILKKGDYVRSPMLYGWANMEGLYRIRNFENWKNEMNENFTEFLPADIQFCNNDQEQTVAHKVKKFYFGDSPVGNNNIVSYINYNTDVMFLIAMQRSVSLQVEAGNNDMYVSVYSYVQSNTSPIPYSNAMGATHCTQFAAVFDQDESILAPEDVAMKRTMRDLWLNFAYTGEPTPDDNIPPSMPKWEPVTANRTPCMDLGQTIRILPGPFAGERQTFWDSVYDLFHREPVAPYDF